MSSLFRVSSFAAAVAASLLAVPQNAHAQLVVGGVAGVEGSTFEFRLVSNGSAAIQTIYDPSALSGLAVGDRITGFAFRLDGIATASAPALDFSDYEIYMGVAATTAANSFSTFANNYDPNRPVVRVRDGLLSLPLGALTGGPGSPEAFGTTISFDQAYAYTGGGLVIEVRHTGNGTQQPLNIDGNLSGNGILTRNTSPSTALSGVTSNTPVTRLLVTPGTAAVPEAGTGALVGLVALPALGAVIIRRSTRRKGNS